MPTYGPSEGECLVFTFKEGLLSPLAHDLKIRVTAYQVRVAEDRSAVEATFDPASLRVVSPMKDGREAQGVLGDVYKPQIDKNIQADVLETKKHGEIRFVSRSVAPEGEGYRVEGELTLHGRTRPLTAQARREGAWLTVEARLHQPDWGIKPYSAMLGTLRIQPDVVVRLSVPAP